VGGSAHDEVAAGSPQLLFGRRLRFLYIKMVTV
jgi:hypothetical protein